MKLTFDFGHRQEEIDLGSPDAQHGLFDNGDIAAFGGNIYLFIDGREYGSLFIHHDDHGPIIELGQFDRGAQQWVARTSTRAVPNDLEETGA